MKLRLATPLWKLFLFKIINFFVKQDHKQTWSNRSQLLKGELPSLGVRNIRSVFFFYSRSFFLFPSVDFFPFLTSEMESKQHIVVVVVVKSWHYSSILFLLSRNCQLTKNITDIFISEKHDSVCFISVVLELIFFRFSEGLNRDIRGFWWHWKKIG